MLFWNCLAVGLGGMIGSIGRYLLGLVPLQLGVLRAGDHFPVMTLFINVLGALLIGFLVAWAARQEQVSPQLLLFLKVGICGGFTTFSTFSLETMQMWEGGYYGAAILYVVLSIILCPAAVWGGQLLK